MQKDLKISQSIVVNATPEKMWQVLTNPELIKEYLYGTETITDWKIGSEIVFQGSYEGVTYRDHGVVLDCVPNELIRYSYWSGFSGLPDVPENYSTLEYRIKVLDAHSVEFTWDQVGFKNEESLAHTTSGMGVFLEQIKEIAER